MILLAESNGDFVFWISMLLCAFGFLAIMRGRKK